MVRGKWRSLDLVSQREYIHEYRLVVTSLKFFMAHKTRGLVLINTREFLLAIYTSFCEFKSRITRH